MTSPQRILITGASSGIGRALAEHYAAAGATVGAVARRADLLDSLHRQHPNVVRLPADVTDGPAMERLIEEFARDGLDMVYANAGVGQHSPEEGWNPEGAREIAMINIVGATNAIAPAAEVMVRQRRGTIVGVSSLAGVTPLPCSAAYGASKAWMRFYLESLDLDLAPLGVRCCVVMPGYIPTKLADGVAVGEVSEGARRAARLIAQRVAAGERVIRFPRRTALLASLARWAPASVKMRYQTQRLEKRRAARRAAATIPAQPEERN